MLCLQRQRQKRKIYICDNIYFFICSHQELLRSQAPVQASLQVLLELGEQLKQQVETSAAASIQSDHVSLTQHLSSMEQSLSRQQATLQVRHLMFCKFLKG